MQALNDSSLVLQAGKLVVVPIANPAAYAQKKRLVESNMNRLFVRHLHPRNDEERAANEILPLIDKCDVLLDLHSCHRLDKPFAFLDYDTPKNRALAAALGLGYICTGWTEVYTGDGIFAPGAFDYAHSKGKTAAFAECGWEDEPQAIAAARNCLRNCLIHLKMLPFEKRPDLSPREIRFERRIVKEAPGDFTRAWKHFDTVKKGDIIATYKSGKDIIADRDGVILFPTPDAPLSDAWFYLGSDRGLFKP